MQTLIDDLAAKDAQFKAKLEVSFSRPPLEVARDHEIVGALTRAYTETVKKVPEFIGVSGWMDSAILAEAGIPSVIIGPAGEGFHAATEYRGFCLSHNPDKNIGRYDYEILRSFINGQYLLRPDLRCSPVIYPGDP